MVCNKNPTSPFMADVKRNTSGHVGMKLNSREKYKKKHSKFHGRSNNCQSNTIPVQRLNEFGSSFFSRFNLTRTVYFYKQLLRWNDANDGFDGVVSASL